MVKNAIRVCVRSRPTANFATDVVQIDPTSRAIQVFQKKKENSGVVNNQQESYSFRFDTILHNSSQETVYAECGREYVKSVLEGYNGTLLTYGQTGAGKTFTMTGGTSNYQYRGIIPRIIADLFREVNQRADQSITVRVSYLEIYNEAMFDLLSPVPLAEQMENGLSIVEDAKGNVAVKGLSCLVANTEEEALNHLFEGEMSRSIGEHQLNKTSSRSHCIFTLYVETSSRIKSDDRVTTSKLNLVDLAGSERVAKTLSEGNILREAMYINKSLTFLEQVVVALGDRHRDHIPFRQSKLTHVLKDSIGGNCRTTLIANVWPEGRHLEETVSTLKFATRMSRIRNDAIVNLKADPELQIRRMEREIRELKQELSMHDALANRSGITYGAFSEDQKKELQKRVTAFIRDGVELDIESLRFAREAFFVFRDLVIAAEDNAKTSPSATVRGEALGKQAGDDSRRIAAEGDVGEIEEAAGFGVGIAADDARPPTSLAIATPRRHLGQQETPELMDREKPMDEGTGNVSGRGEKPFDKALLFEEYKSGDGFDVNQNFKENLSELKELAQRIKELAKEVNSARKNAEQVKTFLDEKRSTSERNVEDVEVIDEEEFAAIKELKDLKTLYREKHKEWKELKDRKTHVELLVDACRIELVNKFEDWLEKNYGVTRTMKSSNERLSPEKNRDQDVLDQDEEFDKLEMERIIESDPDSTAFYKAQKAANQRLAKQKKNSSYSRRSKHV